MMMLAGAHLASPGGSMRRVAVIGTGVTRFGTHDRTSAELFAEAAADALVDAEITPSQVQALYFGNVTGGPAEHQLHMAKNSHDSPTQLRTTFSPWTALRLRFSKEAIEAQSEDIFHKTPQTSASIQALHKESRRDRRS